MRPGEPTTFDGIDRTLPNGFHDGQLYGLHVDRTRHELKLILGADISEYPDPKIRYRRCSVTVSGLLFLQVEPAFVSEDPDRGMIDSGPLEGKELQRVFASPLPSGAFATWIFVGATNSFVRFAGRAASFEWLE